MSLAKLLNQPLTIQHIGRLSSDAYGNDTVGISSTDDIVGYLEQTESEEIVVDRETYIANYRATLPADIDLSASDRIVDAAGVTYEVIGPPNPAYNPRTQQTALIVAKLRVTNG